MNFGQKVAWNNVLERRVRFHYPWMVNVPERWKEWKSKRKKGEGVFLGIRTLSQGITERIEGSFVYEGKRYFKAAIVCSEKRRPIYVPLNTLKIVE